MKRWFPLLLLAWCAAAQAGLEQLRYLSEEYPPFNYTGSDGKPAGLAVNLLREVWQQTGTAPQPVSLLPWASAYFQLTQQRDVVLFSTARTKAREPLFKWACPIGQVEMVLLGLSSAAIKLDTLDDARRYRIAAVQSDVGEQLLLSQGFDEQQLHLVSLLPEALELLQTGKVDLISTNRATVFALISDNKLPLEHFTSVWTLSAEPLCFAFSPGIDDALVAEFQAALTRISSERSEPPLPR